MKTKQLDYRNILGDPMTQAEVMEQIARDKEACDKFQELTDELREELF